MFLRTWRFITLFFVALLMGSTFSHLLEMPAKMAASAELWLTFQQTLYHNFSTLGGVVEIGAIFSTLVLILLSRRHPTAFYLSGVAILSLSTAFFVVWILFTNEVNIETAKWTARIIPPDWADWRTQWEASHAVRCALHVMAFGALAASFLSEVPTDEKIEKRKSRPLVRKIFE
jgi:hypothetical protein